MTYSTYAQVEFSLNNFSDVSSIQSALSNVPYRAGWTATAWALYWGMVLLDPAQPYGARPESEGIPRIAVLITDGRSNLFPIDAHATALQESGVQVGVVWRKEGFPLSENSPSPRVFGWYGSLTPSFLAVPLH